jgi:hypothetical protein
MVCAMNSVSRVACINAARVYDDRELKAERSDEETWVRRCLRTIESSGDDRVEGWRLDDDDEVDGIVVVISVWTSTRASIVLYT